MLASYYLVAKMRKPKHHEAENKNENKTLQFGPKSTTLVSKT